MLSIETESKLAQIFFTIIHSERQVEEGRYYLSKNLDFDPYSSFKSLDRLSIGSLSTSDLSSLLEKHHIFSSENELLLAIRQYDTNFDGRLSIEEFFQLVLPSTNSTIRNLAISRRGVFSPEVEYLLVRLLQSEVQFHRNLESAKREVVLRPDYSMVNGFNSIDIHNVSFIDRNSLSSFLKRHEVVYEDDIDAIFRRVDNDGDQVINYTEFVDTVMPNQPPSFRNSSTSGSFSQRNNYLSATASTSFLSNRKSSPLRSKNQVQSSLSTNSLRNSLNQSQLSVRNYSPLRNTFQNPTFSSSMRASRNTNSLRNWKTYSSPLKDSIRRPSPVQELSYKNSSPLRTSTLNTSRTRNFSGFNKTGDLKTSLRKSSPLRRLSPDRFLSDSKPEYLSLSRSSRNLNQSLEEKELVVWFEEEIKVSREIERKKNELALKHDFNLFDAFRLFDKYEIGSITSSDFEETFRYYSFYPPRDEVYLLVKHFSNYHDNKLRFADFSELLTPKQEEYARILRNRGSANPINVESLFSTETITVLLDCFKLLLDAESLAERVRQRLSRIPNFNLHQAFIAIDKDRNGFITIDEFQSVLQSHGIFATSKDLLNLMQKYDKNKDGRVSYSEFIEEVTPKSPRRY